MVAEGWRKASLLLYVL